VLSFGVFAKYDFLIATRGETLRGKSKPCAQLVADSSYALRSQVSVGTTRNMQCGMTLLELIIVVALLSIVALATTSLIIDTGEWKQQQATEDQWLSVKRSILGDNVVDVHHFREYSGFVADMGRLPNCLRELIRPFDCTNDLSAATRLTTFTQDIDSNQWYGWRGPYLGVPGANEYRDGWRNRGRTDDTLNDDDVNYGWLYGVAPNGTSCQDADARQSVAGAIILQSCGDDGDVDNTETGFPGDFPYVEFDGTNVTYIPLVTRYDYQVDLGASWINAPVKVKSSTVGSSRIITANSLRLRINYPVGEAGDIPDLSGITDLDTAPFLSATFPNRDTRLVDATGKAYIGGATPVTLPAGSTLSGTIITAPNGDIVFTDGSDSYLTLKNCPCELEINAGTLTPASPAPPPPALPNEILSGALWLAIKPDNIAPITADLGKYVIEVPASAEISGATVNLPNGGSLSLSGSPEEGYFPKIVLDDASPTVSIGGAYTFEGDLIEIDSTGDQFLVASTSAVSGTLINVAKAVPSIPQGLRNITIICEAGLSEAGFLYDGDCTDGTSSPIAIPYQLEVSPRSYIPVPDEIVWDIQ
jgi:prepilin-type N-terminal cleavage/methylation domain-containing protein